MIGLGVGVGLEDKTVAGQTIPVPATALLIENGDALATESGDILILES